MLTQDAVIETVRNYAGEIKSRGINLHTVILYGSFAKGTQHEWSDIDVALVSDEFTRDDVRSNLIVSTVMKTDCFTPFIMTK